ncbi:MAG TPA: hypothetical protein VLM40_14855, partial [Gemmata sp.]|nr:hypothetical protein [Gemmata sp.]
KNTYLSAFYRRMCVRKGAPKAVVALAHHMITVVFHILNRKEKYVELGGNYYDERNQEKVIRRLVARLNRLGCEVDVRVPTAVAPALEAAVAAEPIRADEVGQIEEFEGESRVGRAPKKKGRPCKCAERNIPCKHRTFADPNSLREQASSPVQFS